MGFAKLPIGADKCFNWAFDINIWGELFLATLEALQLRAEKMQLIGVFWPSILVYKRTILLEA